MSSESEHFLGDEFSEDSNDNNGDKDERDNITTTEEYTDSYSEGSSNSEEEEDYESFIKEVNKQFYEYKEAVELEMQRDKERIHRLESDLDDERDENEALKNKMMTLLANMQQSIQQVKKLQNENEDLLTKIDEARTSHIETIHELQSLKKGLSSEQISRTGKQELEVMLRVTMEGMTINGVECIQNKDSDKEDLRLQKNILEKKWLESKQDFILQKEAVVKEKEEVEKQLKNVNKEMLNLQKEKEEMKEKLSQIQVEQKQNSMIETGQYHESMMFDALGVINKLTQDGSFREISRITIDEIKRYIKENCYFPRMFMKIEDDCSRVLDNSYRKWSSNNKKEIVGNEKIPLVTFVTHYSTSQLYGDYLRKKNDKGLEYYDLLVQICLFNKKYSLDPNVKKTYGKPKTDSSPITFGSESLSATSTSPVDADKKSVVSVTSKGKLDDASSINKSKYAIQSVPQRSHRKRSETLAGFFRLGNKEQEDHKKDEKVVEPQSQQQTDSGIIAEQPKNDNRLSRRSIRKEATPISFDELVGQIELHDKVEKSKGNTLKMPGVVTGIVQYGDIMYVTMMCYGDKCIGWIRAVDVHDPKNIISTHSYQHEIVKVHIFNSYLFLALSSGKVMIFEAKTFQTVTFEDDLHPGIVDFFCYKDTVYLLLLKGGIIRYSFNKGKVLIKELKYKGIPIGGKRVLVREDLLLIATNSGITKFDLKTKSALKKEEQIQLKTTHMLFIDSNLWTYYPDVRQLNVYNETLQILHSFEFDDVVFIVECGTNVWVGLNTNQLVVVDIHSYEVIQTHNLSDKDDVSLITGQLAQLGNDSSTATFQFWASTDDSQIHFLQTIYKCHDFIPSVQEAQKCFVCHKPVKQKDCIECSKCKIALHKSCNPYTRNIPSVCKGKSNKIVNAVSTKLDGQNNEDIIPSPRKRVLQKRMNRTFTIRPVSGGISFPDDWK